MQNPSPSQISRQVRSLPAPGPGGGCAPSAGSAPGRSGRSPALRAPARWRWLPPLLNRRLNPLLNRLLPALLLILVTAAPAADGPPESPQLRLETGAHTAPIRRIAADRAGRWIVSASEDKTLRLWDAADGRLLRVDRPPIGDGNEGKLYAVAMDPAGDWIAAGGYTGWDWDGAVSILILERASGQLRQRIGGLGNEILHLCVSPDGSRLAAMLGGGQGLRVYAADAGFTEVFKDRDYGDRSFGCAFAADGRLVTTNYDGQVRLYAPTTAVAVAGRDQDQGPGLRRVAVARPDGGKQPYAVAFHPDGERIAVGFSDSTAVEVLDGADLHRRYAADTDGIGNGNLGRVAWSRDGTRLLAGGTYYDGGGGCPMLSWDQAGEGPRRAWPAADNTVMDLVALPGGDTAVGAGDPALLRLATDGQARWRQTPAIADLRAMYGQFRVSVDGRQVAFGFKVWGKDPAWLDLTERRLHQGEAPDATDGDPIRALQQALAARGYDPGPLDGELGPATRAAAARFARDQGLPAAVRSATNPATDPALTAALGLTTLAPPRTRAPGLDIQGWEDTTEPTLNGRPLTLEPYEMARALAIAPDGDRFLLGTNWRLRLFNADGDQIWERPVPGEAWGVNLSADGRLALAAFGDGSIRWFRLSDGAELLAFFPERGGKDWVLWTPSGYYDASPGGDRLIGWHLNNGRDQLADFVPAAQLRGRFYQPQVVTHVLDTLDEDQAIARAGIRRPTDVASALPPTLALLDPVDGALFTRAELTLRYRAESRNGAPITKLQVLVDGRPLADARGLARVEPANGPAGDGIATLPVVLPERDLELSLIAENAHGASPPASVRLAWGGRAAEPFSIKPRLYALVVGVGDYADDTLDLRFPAKDARDFARVLRAQQGGLYREVQVRLLADADAATILDGLDWLRREVTAKDLGLLYLAGHGVNDEDGDYYYLPADVNTDRLRRTAIPYFEIQKTLGALSGKTLAFIDTCHAGNVMGARRGVADITAVVNDLAAAENGVVVFAGSSGKQFAQEDPAWGNGAFTKALVEGLSGQADYTRDGTITINQLDLWLSERVKALTRNRQTPTTTKPVTIPDYPIAVVQ